MKPLKLFGKNLEFFVLGKQKKFVNPGGRGSRDPVFKNRIIDILSCKLL